MIVVDASALLAIYFEEPEAGDFKSVLVEEEFAIPSPAAAEASLKLLSQDLSLQEAQKWIASLERAGANIADFTSAMAHVAIAARAVYGKGRHQAKLNYGDCLVYGAAKIIDGPLLFKGDDFHHTDLSLHPASPAPGGRLVEIDNIVRINKDGSIGE